MKAGLLKPQEFKPFDNYQNVYVSNMLMIVDENHVQYRGGFGEITDSKPLVVSKYMKMSYLIDSINNDYFFLGSPETWLDPFEMLFYKPIIKIGEEDNVTVHACSFACNDIENEEGFWIIWSKGESDPIVRVTYNVKKLMELLAIRENEEFYLGGMVYTSREQILKEAAIPHTYSKIEDYINKLSLKRNAYQYENELRLYVKKNGSNKPNTMLRDFNYRENVISEITLPPMEPLGNSHPAKDMVKCIQDCMNMQTKQRLFLVVQEKGMNCKISQSALYCTGIRERSY